MVFRKFLQQDKDNDNLNDDKNEEYLLPISPFHNGGAVNLEVDSYLSLLCWLQSLNYRKIVCSNLNGENPTVKFYVKNKAEKIVGFAMDSNHQALFVMVSVSLRVVGKVRLSPK